MKSICAFEPLGYVKIHFFAKRFWYSMLRQTILFSTQGNPSIILHFCLPWSVIEVIEAVVSTKFRAEVTANQGYIMFWCLMCLFSLYIITFWKHAPTPLTSIYVLVPLFKKYMGVEEVMFLYTDNVVLVKKKLKLSSWSFTVKHLFEFRCWRKICW